jgi:hypothetical protein
MCLEIASDLKLAASAFREEFDLVELQFPYINKIFLAVMTFEA